MDWATWAPGDAVAAGLVADGGLAALLDDAAITIRGITGTALDALGNRIAEGLASGQSVDALGRSLRDYVGSASRAEMIAHTETARAMTLATLNAYAANGIEDWDLITTEGACQTCLDIEANNPHPVADASGQPPVHPRCRCAASPAGPAKADAGTGGGLSLADLGLAEGDLDAGAGAAEAAGEGAAEEGALEEEAAGEEAAGDEFADLDDDALSEALAGAAASGDEEALGRVLEELDRRDAEAKAAEAKARRAAAREAKRAADAEAKDAEFDKLVERGMDPEAAFSEVYGVSQEQMARDRAIESLRANGYTGKNFEALARQAYKDHAERAYYDAEDLMHGHMLNKAAQKAGINPRSLFTGPESRARKYASEDLLEYFERHGRLTLDDFIDGLLGGAKRSQATGYWR
jgi:SPP1 gp7 family putative phage head morphogenesis protein